MERYLAQLHKKPEHHKKRFAFLTSLTVTLFIFGVWFLAVFPPKADKPLAGSKNNKLNISEEISPLQSLGMTMASSLEALRDIFGELKAGFKTVDFEAEYRDMRDSALDSYGPVRSPK